MLNRLKKSLRKREEELVRQKRKESEEKRPRRRLESSLFGTRRRETSSSGSISRAFAITTWHQSSSSSLFERGFSSKSCPTMAFSRKCSRESKPP
jgi:nicotinic acid phosphoribosyltransferase